MATGAKGKILARIQKALLQPVAKPFADIGEPGVTYHQPDMDLDIAFAENFVHLQGKFVFCLDEAELSRQLLQLFQARKWQKLYCPDPILRSELPYKWFEDLAACDVSITYCEVLIARTGTMVLSAAQVEGRTASVYAPAHICIAYTSQLVPDVEDAFKALHEKYDEKLPSFITFASGPSRTADIEKTLVTGVHGPKEVFCFLVEGKAK